MVKVAEKICRQCGKIFSQDVRGRKLYCSTECKKKHAIGEKTYLEKLEVKKKSKKAAAGSSLSIAEINKLAREAHMNYGQYVAVHNI